MEIKLRRSSEVSKVITTGTGHSGVSHGTLLLSGLTVGRSTEPANFS